MTESTYHRILETIEKALELIPGVDTFWVLTGMIAGAVEKAMPPDSDSYAVALLLRKTPKWTDTGEFCAHHLLFVLEETFKREQQGKGFSKL